MRSLASSNQPSDTFSGAAPAPAAMTPPPPPPRLLGGLSSSGSKTPNGTPPRFPATLNKPARPKCLPLSSAAGLRRSHRYTCRPSRPRYLSLLLAVSALAIVAAMLGHDARPASAGAAATLGDEEGTLMLGTLTVADGGSWRGYRRSPATGQLTQSTFAYQGAGYAINWLNDNNVSDFLILELDKAIPANVKSGLTLHIAKRRFDLADGVINPNNNKQIRWANSVETWTAGDELHITVTYTDYWSATLTVQAIGGGGLGCDSGASDAADRCSTTTTLSDNTITLYGETYTVGSVFVSSGGLQFGFESGHGRGSHPVLSRYTLHLDTTRLNFADSAKSCGSANCAIWGNHGLSWSAGDTVALRLTKPIFTGVTFRETSIPGLPQEEIDERRVREGRTQVVEVLLPRDPGSGNTVTVHLFKPAFNCSDCGDHSLPDREAISIDAVDDDTDSNPETVTLQFTGGSSGNWNTGKELSIFGVVDADGSHDHAMIWATVSTTATAATDWYNQTDGAAGLYVTVTETGDDGTHSSGVSGTSLDDGVTGTGLPNTESDQGSLKRPDDTNPPTQAPSNPPTYTAPTYTAPSYAAPTYTPPTESENETDGNQDSSSAQASEAGDDEVTLDQVETALQQYNNGEITHQELLDLIRRYLAS